MALISTERFGKNVRFWVDKLSISIWFDISAGVLIENWKNQFGDHRDLKCAMKYIEKMLHITNLFPSCFQAPCSLPLFGQILHCKDGRCEGYLWSMYLRFNLPVVHEHIWFPEFMRRHSDILNPTIFTLVPSHINIIPLLNNYNSLLVKAFNHITTDT